MKEEIGTIIDRLLAFLMGTREEHQDKIARRKAIVQQVQESLNNITQTLAYKLQNNRQDPNVAIQISGLVNSQDKLPNDFPKNFKFIVNHGDKQLQGEDKLLDFDQDSALVQAFKLSLDSFEEQHIKFQIWQIGEVDSLYAETEVQLIELEKVSELIFSNEVHLQFRAVLNEHALKMLKLYSSIHQEISLQLQKLSSSTDKSRKKLVQRRLRSQSKRQKLKFVEPKSESYQERVTHIDEILDLLHDGKAPQHKELGIEQKEQQQPMKQMKQGSIERQPHRITQLDQEQQEAEDSTQILKKKKEERKGIADEDNNEY